MPQRARAASQLTGIDYQNASGELGNLAYTYDAAGWRTSVSGTLASTQLPSAVSSATYNANNQLTSWNGAAMTYDLNGKTLNDGTNTYTWDARNRLVSANSGGAGFSYDALGRRASKTLLSTTTSYLYDGANGVQEQSGGAVTANMLTGGVDEYFERTDATGSTLALTDSTGANVEQYSYGPYGMLSASGSNANPYTYTGRESDGLGIDYYRARYYNPATGRFLSEDTSGFAGGVNLYAYADDNPTSFIDPFGLKPHDPNKRANPNNPDAPNSVASLMLLPSAPWAHQVNKMMCAARYQACNLGVGLADLQCKVLEHLPKSPISPVSPILCGDLTKQLEKAECSRQLEDCMNNSGGDGGDKILPHF
jgi:RHS repeat-associated protein